MTRNAPRTHRMAARTVGLAVVVALAGAAAVLPAATASASTPTAPHAVSSSQVTHTGLKYSADHPAKAPMRLMGAKVATPAASVNLKPWAVTVGNQGDHESCVGWAIGYELMGLEANRAGLAHGTFAPYYVFSQINGGFDQPTDPLDAMNIIAAQGVDTIPHYWQEANGNDDPITRPDQSEVANAAPFRVVGVQQWFYARAAGLDGIAAIKAALTAGHPVAIGMRLHKGFYDMRFNSGITFDSDNAGADLGGHEVLAVGYDSSGLLIQNSWDTSFGAGGFATLGWNVVQTDVNSAFSITGFASKQTTTSTDKTPPTVTAPNSLPQLYSSTSTTGVTSYTTTFTASDASGIAATALDVSVYGAAYTALTLPSATATSGSYNLTPGHTYRFISAAQDKAGNWSAWAMGRRSGSAATPRPRPPTRPAGWRPPGPRRSTGP